MAITTMDGLINGLANSQNLFFVLPSVTNVVGGYVAINTTAGATWGTLANPTANTSGGQTYNNNSSPQTGFPTWTANAGGAAKTYVSRIVAESAQINRLYVYDLLWACSGFSGTVATAQTVTSFSGMPTRNSTGLGTELWFVCFTALGSTSKNLTVSYTNSSGTAGQTSISTAIPASIPASRMIQLPLANGDTGVQSIASCTLSGSTGTAGNFGLAILDPITTIGMTATNTPEFKDFTTVYLPAIDDNASLLMVSCATTTSTGQMLGSIGIIQG